MSGAGLQVEPRAALVEMDGHAALFGGVHQCNVQLRARNGIDDFGFVSAVRLKR
jgi:hypothetical protein